VKSPDRLSALVFIALSVILCLGSLSLRAGSLHAPGPMIFPLLLGLCLLGLSIGLFLKRAPSPSFRLSALFPRAEWRAVLQVMAIFFLFALVFERIGAVVGIFLLMLLLLKVMAGRTVVKAALYSAVVTASAYLLFVTLLGVRLPVNALGF
jgi:hypothetical protein